MSEIRVAVCDDETQDLVQILALIQQYDREQLLQITALFHASALLDQKDSFDIVKKCNWKMSLRHLPKYF